MDWMIVQGYDQVNVYFRSELVATFYALENDDGPSEAMERARGFVGRQSTTYTY